MPYFVAKHNCPFGCRTLSGSVMKPTGPAGGAHMFLWGNAHLVPYTAEQRAQSYPWHYARCPKPPTPRRCSHPTCRNVWAPTCLLLLFARRHVHSRADCLVPLPDPHLPGHRLDAMLARHVGLTAAPCPRCLAAVAGGSRAPASPSHQQPATNVVFYVT